MIGGRSTSEGDKKRSLCQEQSSFGAKRSEPVGCPSSATGKGKATSGTRRRARTQGSSSAGEGNAIEADTTLKMLGGGQPLVDDFDDVDFETRKVGRASQSFLLG